MKIRNISKISGMVFAASIVIMANLSMTIGDEQPYVSGRSEQKDKLVRNEISYSFAEIGYKPVQDVNKLSKEDNVSNENYLYKKWCEETFVNGGYVYEAYKNIAFNVNYTPDPMNTDYWQTPTETVRLKKGDCEDSVFLFFSQIPSDQKNIEIVWGWVIKRDTDIGRAHVWYQLADRAGQEYVVEGFSRDWNGIIPMEIIQETEMRKPIFKISHSMVSRLSSLLPKSEEWQMCQLLVSLFEEKQFVTYVSGNGPFSRDMNIQLHISSHEFIEYPMATHNTSRQYTRFISGPSRHRIVPNVSKEISNILEKLHDVFARYENQRNSDSLNMY